MSNPFSNPFSTSSAEPTDQGGAAPVAPVRTHPLAGPRVAAQPTYNAPARTASAGPVMQTPVAGSANGWSPTGGTPIVVAQGETVSMLSQRYGVPPVALLKANGFASAGQVQPGTRLIVPVYRAGSGGSQVARAETPSRRVAAEPVRVAEKATRLDRVATAKAREPERLAAEKTSKADKLALAKAERLAAERTAKADKMAERGSKAERLAAEKTAKAEKLAAEKSAKTDKLASAKALKAEKLAARTGKTTVALNEEPKTPAKLPSKPLATAKVALAAPRGPAAPAGGSKVAAAGETDMTPTSSLPPAGAEPASNKPEFRWPARGRIIEGFKAGGNDGINIALPEGTSIKAAEAGVVAYAGSELKGYGNMILIRHPNGYVSAYANNGELAVKRGDQVKRGQIIAKSGQSGNVAAPQLHFELRKGSTPVDPTGYLAGL